MAFAVPIKTRLKQQLASRQWVKPFCKILGIYHFSQATCTKREAAEIDSFLLASIFSDMRYILQNVSIWSPSCSRLGS